MSARPSPTGHGIAIHKPKRSIPRSQRIWLTLAAVSWCVSPGNRMQSGSTDPLSSATGMAWHGEDLPRARHHRPRAGQLDEARDWHRKALAIFEELGDRHGMALTYAVFGERAEERGQPHLAIWWNIRCVSLFDQYPSPLTGSGPAALVRLTRQLGMPALDEAWQQVTGQPVPRAIRDHITSHYDEEP